MIHRALDSGDDWQFGKGLQSYTSNLNAVILNIRTRLKSWKGDSFKDPEEGVDYYNFLDKNTKSFLDADVKRVVLQSEGILKILSFTSGENRETREYTASLEVLTVYGIGTVEV